MDETLVTASSDKERAAPTWKKGYGLQYRRRPGRLDPPPRLPRPPGPGESRPDTLRYRIWHIPARLARHARQRILKISPDWPWKDAFLTCWQRLSVMPAPV